jgi:endonuclease G, mitochondrial
MKSSSLRTLVVCAITSLFAAVLFADIAIPTGAPYVQTFDTLGASATATLPTDFRLDRPATVRTLGTFATATTATTATGGTSLSSTATNGAYNLGATANSGDRAVGFLSSGSATASGNLYVQLANTTGGPLTGLTISYDVEKYRQGSNVAGFCFQLYSSTNGTSWTSAGPAFLTSFPGDAGSGNAGYPTAPGAVQSVSNQTLDVPVPNGASLFLAWNYSVCSGTTTTNAQALAIDNISIRGIAGTGPTAPSGSGAATPSTVAAGDASRLTVAVTPGTSPVAGVAANLSAIGGASAQAFFDNGTNGDLTPGDNIYSFSAIVALGTSGGLKNLAATITDTQGLSGAANIALNVLAPTAPSGTGTANPSSAAPGDTTTLTVTVTPGANPASTGLSVTGNLAAIGGNAVTQFQGSGTTFTFSAIVAQGTAAGARSLPITVTDAENRSSSFNLPLNVSAANVDSTIVISQVYGGGGNTGAPYNRDYVQLYNRGTATVDITGWSLQYASAAGNNWTNRQPLGGSIAPGNYYLVALASGAVGTDLPASQISGEINMSGTAGKIALVDNFDFLTGGCPVGDGHIRDFVGYGPTATCSEGAANAPAPSNTTAIIRKGGGFTDTDVNAGDFATGAPAPLQTEPIVELGPLVLSTDPRTNGFNVPRDATIQVSFTEAVDVSGAWFDISCATSGRHDSATFATDGGDRYITPNDNFAAGEQCTVTIFKDHLADHDLDDSGPDTDTLRADYVWSFTVATGTAPVFPASVHLAMGNPSGATTTNPLNYLMEKPEYTLSYNRDRGGPNWASWHLSEEWVGTLARVDTFRPDPAVPPDWYRVQSFDFSGSGFDRGHMVPNADRDKETSSPINQATFLMSNMLAQAPDNNQGPWANLENDLRALLPAGPGEPAKEIYIVAGGAGSGGTGSSGAATTLANGHVTVPAYTWKVALVIPAADGDDLSRVSCTTRTIAVILPNVQRIRNDDWHKYLTTVDAVETLTGYNFFSNLPAPIQRCIEAGTNGVNPPLVKGDQVVGFDAPGDHTYGDAPFTVGASGGHSGNPVTFAASGACSSSGANGSTISMVAAGTCTITASQAGSDLYDAASDVVRAFTVSKAAPAFSSLTSATIEAGSAATTFSGTLAANGLVPPGSVVITVGGSSVTAPIGAGGSFSASVATGSLAASATPYAVIYQYAGSANFSGASGAGTLTVVDTTAPSLTAVTATPGLLGPPNHKLIDVTIGYTTADLSGAPACTLSVSSNEAANAQGDGNTAIDWQVRDPHHVLLRAERAGGGGGRLYSVAIHCSDSFGNSSNATAAVSVSK